MVNLTHPNLVRIMVNHGANLNLLGVRDPDIYGKDDFGSLNRRIEDYAKNHGIEVKIFQSNSEGALIAAIQESRAWAEAIVINPGAYTHYSYGIRDALADSRLPVIEVHITNIYAREEFRRHSVIAPIATGQIVGFGSNSYLLAVDAARTLVEESRR